MDTGGAEPHDSSRNPTLRAIASSRRRAVLGYLLDRGSPVTEQALVTTLAATERGKTVADVTLADVRAVRAELTHVHLPVLADVGLITHDPTEGTVATASHPALEDPRFRQLLAVDADGFDAVLSSLSHDHRRIVLTTLRDERTPTSRADLAQELLRRGAATGEPDPAAVERVAASLHHTHLPKLAHADLVEYDPETGRTAYTHHPALEKTFGIIYEPDEHLVEKFDGFLNGLGASYRQASRDVGEPVGWPDFWREPHSG